MPIFYTLNGKIKYKPQVIYWGVHNLNKSVAQKNLCDIKRILDQEKIRFLLLGGTLLGAVREHDFIAHDEDVDLAILSEDKQAVIDILPKILSTGFNIARYDKRDLLSIIRDGEYIDFNFFRPKEKGIRTSNGWLVLEKFLLNTMTMEFKGEVYLVPRDHIEYLRCEYGDNWRTPIKWFNYSMPWWKKILFKLRALAKEYFPNFILKYLLKIKENSYEAGYRKRVNAYLSNGGTID